MYRHKFAKEHSRIDWIVLFILNRKNFHILCDIHLFSAKIHLSAFVCLTDSSRPSIINTEEDTLQTVNIPKPNKSLVYYKSTVWLYRRENHYYSPYNGLKFFPAI